VFNEEALREWTYGLYEGKTPKEIKEDRKARGVDQDGKVWDIWRDGCEEGESPAEVKERIDGLIERIKEIQMGGKAEGGDVLLVSHGHLLRAFTKRWLQLEMDFPFRMILEPGGIGTLSYAHNSVDEPALVLGAPAEE